MGQLCFQCVSNLQCVSRPLKWKKLQLKAHSMAMVPNVIEKILVLGLTILSAAIVVLLLLKKYSTLL